MSLEVVSGIVVQTSPLQTMNAAPMTLFGALAGAQGGIGGTSGLDNKFAINVFIVSGSVVTTAGGSSSSNISGGVTVSGAVQVSGTIYIITSGTAIAVGSGSILPVTVLSGSVAALSGLNVVVATLGANVSGGVSVSGGVTISGGVTVSGSVAVLSGVITSGVFDLNRWPTYTLISYWSGAVGKDIIGLYHGGGTAGNQSGKELEITAVEIGIIASGLYNRFDVILSSGVVSGSAGTKVAYRAADPASVVSGVVDGGTNISGQFSIGTIHSIIAESNSSGIMHGFPYRFPAENAKMPRILSGEAVFVRMVSGIGIGVAKIDWIERYP